MKNRPAATYEELASIALEQQAELDRLRDASPEVERFIEELRTDFEESVKEITSEAEYQLRSWRERVTAEFAVKDATIVQLRQKLAAGTTIRKVVRDKESSNIVAIVDVPADSAEAQALTKRAEK